MKINNLKIFWTIIVALLFVSVLISSASVTIVYSQLYEWRGPGRSGIYNETGLMKKWADGKQDCNDVC